MKPASLPIKLWSDVHVEFTPLVPHYSPADQDTVLIIAGDLCPVKSHDPFALLQEYCQHFKAVIMVSGNHEYYGSYIPDVDRRLVEISTQIPNFHFLNPGKLILDGVLFVGGTLWTDLRGGDPLIRLAARNDMNDYRKIKYRDAHGNYEPFRPETGHQINAHHRQFFREALEEAKVASLPAVVISHHAPLVSLLPRFGDSDYCFGNTGLEDLISQYQPVLWVHGHTHYPYRKVVFNTEFVCNPRGYVGHEPQTIEWDRHGQDLILEVPTASFHPVVDFLPELPPGSTSAFCR